MTLKEANLDLAKRYLKMVGFNKDQHLRNMCLTLIEKIAEWPDDKSSRWLGFIQHGVIDHKLTSIEKERNYSRPLFHSVYESQNQPLPESVDVTGEEDTKKLSGMGEHIVLFKHGSDGIFEIVHMVAFEELPNVATLAEIFDELVNDEEFKMDADFVKQLSVDIMTMKDYIAEYGELEFHKEDE